MKKLIVASGIVSLLTGAFLLTSPSAYAATPPDSCFSFSGGYIGSYYDNEDNNPANPACPKDVDIPSSIGGESVTTVNGFAGKQLTSVTIPNTVTDIPFYAFADNLLTSIVIPNSVTSMGSMAFANNRLASVTLSTSLTSLGYQVFVRNQLASVVIPTSVTYIDQDAFNNQGVNVNEYMSNNYSSLRNVYFTRLYTEDSSNPANLQDAQWMSLESDYGVDINGDGDQLDNFSQGGHLINPAQVVISYKDSTGNTIAPTTNVTGTGLSNYIANDNTTHDLSRYFRLGSNQAFAARNIAGYTLVSPSSPHTMTLAAADGNNSLTFVYTPSSTSPGSSNEVPSAPDTGAAPALMSGVVVLGSLLTALVAIFGGRFAWNKLRTSFIRR